MDSEELLCDTLPKFLADEVSALLNPEHKAHSPIVLCQHAILVIA